MLLQVHDELVLEVPAADVDAVRHRVQALMENAVELSVPLDVVTGVGRNWFECK
jgi:DNA polymerase I